MLMDGRLANKVEIGQLFSKSAQRWVIHDTQFISVNEYSLYAALMLSITTSGTKIKVCESCDFVRIFYVSSLHIYFTF